MTYAYSYDSIAELVEASMLAPVHADNKALARQLAGDMNQGRGWVCADRPEIKGARQAVAAMAEPLFQAGVARIERLMSQLVVPDPVSIKRRMRRDDHGDELDMQRVWQGELDQAWTHAKRMHAPTAQRVIVGVFLGCLANEGSDVVAWRGVAALALAQALETAGYSVRVVAMARATLWDGLDSKTAEDVVVKAENEQLDLHRAASLVASTLLFRAVLLMHRVVKCTREIGDSISGTDYARAGEIDASGFDYACVAGRDCEGAGKAQAWIAKHVEAIQTRNREA